MRHSPIAVFLFILLLYCSFVPTQSRLFYYLGNRKTISSNSARYLFTITRQCKDRMPTQFTPAVNFGNWRSARTWHTGGKARSVNWRGRGHVDLPLARTRVMLTASHTLTQCWFNVDPASTTLGQHSTNIESLSCSLRMWFLKGGIIEEQFVSTNRMFNDSTRKNLTAIKFIILSPDCTHVL